MSFLDRIRKDKMQAMKDKDQVRKAVLTNLMSVVSLAEKEAKRNLSDSEALAFVQKEVKVNEDALASLPADRLENIEEAKARIEILRSYLPSQLSDEDLEKEVQKIIEREGLERSPKSLGKIIPVILTEFPGQTDGARVSKVCSKLLK